MFSALRLLVVQRVSTCQFITCSKYPLYFLVRLLAPDYTYTGVGLQTVWLESPYFYRGRLSWQFLAVNTVSQCPVAWSPDCNKGIPWLTEGLTDEWLFVDILLHKQGEWTELTAYNCFLNWVFLFGKRCCLLPFLGIIVMGECHHEV